VEAVTCWSTRRRALQSRLTEISAADFAEVLHQPVGAFVLTKLVTGPMRSAAAGASSTSAPLGTPPPFFSP
jgi:hypothetical protein